MALKAVYDSTAVVAGWFDPLAVVEGWLDAEYEPSTATAPVTLTVTTASPVVSVPSQAPMIAVIEEVVPVPVGGVMGGGGVAHPWTAGRPAKWRLHPSGRVVAGDLVLWDAPLALAAVAVMGPDPIVLAAEFPIVPLVLTGRALIRQDDDLAAAFLGVAASALQDEALALELFGWTD